MRDRRSWDLSLTLSLPLGNAYLVGTTSLNSDQCQHCVPKTALPPSFMMLSRRLLARPI